MVKRRKRMVKDQEVSESVSESSSEDDEKAELLTEELEEGFLRVLSRLKKKDKTVYDENATYYTQPTKDNALESLKENKKVTKDILKKWLEGKKDQVNDPNLEQELEGLHDFWANPSLNKDDQFLRDYILNKKFLEEDKDFDLQKALQTLDSEEEEINKQLEYEEKFNHRYENTQNQDSEVSKKANKTKAKKSIELNEPNAKMTESNLKAEVLLNVSLSHSEVKVSMDAKKNITMPNESPSIKNKLFLTQTEESLNKKLKISEDSSVIKSAKSPSKKRRRKLKEDHSLVKSGEPPKKKGKIDSKVKKDNTNKQLNKSEVKLEQDPEKEVHGERNACETASMDQSNKIKSKKKRWSKAMRLNKKIEKSREQVCKTPSPEKNNVNKIKNSRKRRRSKAMQEINQENTDNPTEGTEEKKTTPTKNFSAKKFKSNNTLNGGREETNSLSNGKVQRKKRRSKATQEINQENTDNPTEGTEDKKTTPTKNVTAKNIKSNNTPNGGRKETNSLGNGKVRRKRRRSKATQEINQENTDNPTEGTEDKKTTPTKNVPAKNIKSNNTPNGGRKETNSLSNGKVWRKRRRRKATQEINQENTDNQTAGTEDKETTPTKNVSSNKFKSNNTPNGGRKEANSLSNGKVRKPRNRRRRTKEEIALLASIQSSQAD